ncbi:membrane protein [Tsukamurella pulmonis]|nr:membrane protein [Tsukamurella pulmonis]
MTSQRPAAHSTVRADARSYARIVKITRKNVSILGLHVIRAGLVINIGWNGVAKFTAEEANAIEPLISRSPLMSWLLDVAPLRTVSSAIGVVELGVTALLVAGTASQRANDLAVLGSAGMFVGTSSFLFTSIDYDLGAMPPDPFILKDVVLLGAALALAVGTPALEKKGDPVTTGAIAA